MVSSSLNNEVAAKRDASEVGFEEIYPKPVSG
jgi:hypothetical protein